MIPCTAANTQLFKYNSDLSLTRYHSLGVWQLCLWLFLLILAHFSITKVIGRLAQSPRVPPQVGMMWPALQDHRDPPAIPPMESSQAGGGISCITVTSHSQLPVRRASNSAFQKTLIKKKGSFFSWLLQMKKLFAGESWVIFMEMGRALALFIAVTEAIESIFYWYVFTCPQKSYCTVVERTLFRFSILK